MRALLPGRSCTGGRPAVDPRRENTAAPRPISGHERAAHALGRPGDGAAGHQRGDLVLAVAGLAEDLLGVLAERRPRPAAALPGRRREPDGNPELAHGPRDAGLVE